MAAHAHQRRANVPAPLQIRPSQSFDGFDGKWSTFVLGAGTPPQNFRVLPGTQVSESWVISSAGCIPGTDPTDCYTRRGGEAFNGNAPAGFMGNQSSTWNEIGLYGLNQESNLGISGTAEFGSDVVSINGGNSSGGVSLPNQIVASVPDKAYFLGALGLNARPSQFSSGANSKKSFLENLYNAKLIPSVSFGYTAGAYYGDNGKSNYGSLTLGGYDSTRMQASRSLSIKFSANNARQLQVGVQSITVSGSLNGTASMTAGTQGHLSLIDSTVSQLWLPRAVCDNFASSFGLVYDNNTDLYAINSTIHNKWVSENPSFTFKLGDTPYDSGNSVNIILPYKAFDFSVGWPIYSSSVNYFPIRRAANDTQYTLGRTLLQQAYIVVDYERQNFTLAAADFPDSNGASNIVTIATTGGLNGSTSSSSGLGAGAIAGIVIGALALLAAILALVFFLVRRRRRRVAASASPTAAELDASEKYGGRNSLYPKVADGSDALHEAAGGELTELPGHGGLKGHDGEGTGGAAELETPPPIFEMEGEGSLLSPHGARGSPLVSSAGGGSGSWSEGKPSPLGSPRG